MNKEKLPDEQVNLKLSICNKCNEIVRIAFVDRISKKRKIDFLTEVWEYNLSVKDQLLSEYRKANTKWCECN